MAGNMNTLMAVEIETGVTGNYDYVVTRGFEIVDATVCTNLADAGTTQTVQTSVGGGAYTGLTNGMAGVAVDDIHYADTLATGQATLTAGDTIRAVVAGCTTANQASVFVWLVPTTWISG